MFGLFDSDDENDDGCNGHHYGEWEKTGSKDVCVGEEVVTLDGDTLNMAKMGIIRSERKKVCQHEGCSDTVRDKVDESMFLVDDVGVDIETEVMGNAGYHGIVYDFSE